MRTTTAVVIGAGQAGLATSRCLTSLALDLVVLDRADVANSWRNDCCAATLPAPRGRHEQPPLSVPTI
jgi:putative flavoprotein involved in K+ transport